MNPRYQLAQPELGAAEADAVRAVLESGWVTQGPKVAEFERAVADVGGAVHGIAVSSCTAALHLALVCGGVGPGDEVIVPSMSFIATANAVVHAGATPVFAEVDESTYNLDVADVEARITDRTRAIMLVHQLGLPADIDAFSKLAHARGLLLIEDAACAIGSAYHGAPIGSHSEFVCFSFHPRKLLTTGDGGMILTPSDQHSARLRRLRHHGMSVSDLERHSSDDPVKESYDEIGWNYRLTDIQAAIGIEQVKRLPGILAHRQKLAAAYDDAFRDAEGVLTPLVPADVVWNVQTYTIRLATGGAPVRDELVGQLLRRGIATRPGVMTAHREMAYSKGAAPVSLPRSEWASDSSIALPLHGGLTEDACLDVAQNVVSVLGDLAR